MQQEIRFCNARDGVRIAYATAGSGPPLVWAAMWLQHLEFDGQSPLWLPFSEGLTRCSQLVRYDQRGCGLSDRQVTDISVDGLVEDLDVVVDSLGLGQFSLFGTSYSGVVAITYATRHPERVSRLVLYGAYARGWARRGDAQEAQRVQTLISLARQGWGQENPVYRQMITTLFAPEADPEHVRLLCDQGRVCTSGDAVARQLEVFGPVDITSLLPRIQAPTLVLHRHGDTLVPFEEGRRLAAGIPGARLIELPGRNHFPLPGESVQGQLMDEVNRFLAAGRAPSKSAVAPPPRPSPAQPATSVEVIRDHLQPSTKQEIRFCTAPDGVRIAYATAGEGPPLVKAANWLNHLEFDWQSPIWRPTFEELARDFRLIRYDERGNGLSDWDAKELSLEAFVRDLEAVVDAAGVERFPLLGISQGGAVSVAYAVRHPERVSHLILYGAYARGWALREDDAQKLKREAMITLIEQGWGQDNPAFRQMWSALYIPKGNSEQMNWLSELQRISTSPANAARLVNVLSSLNVSDVLARVRVPTLVLHVRDDAAVPLSEGRRLAAGIPGARFVELPGCNHLPLQGEPAWDILINEVRRFLGAAKAPRVAASDASTRTAGKGVGERLAHYRVIAALGAGGMGVVYRARDTKLEREVALKVLPDALMSSATARARLVREAKTASALNHPNICHIYEVGEADGHSYIAMEHVGGRPLAQSIPAEGLPSETVLRYAVQLSDALAHAHERNVLHRDMKSANVMVTPEGHVKVLDFGLAKRAVAESDEGAMTVDSVTQAGAVAGTLHYLAPELLRGQPADARSDIWALGVVLFEMATGKFPFSGKTGFEVSAAILRESPQQLPAKVPAGLRAIIARCLAKEPSQRYQRASELRAAVEAISSDSAAAPVAAAPAGSGPAPDSASQPGAASVPALALEPPRPRKWLIWGGALLALLLLGALWFQQPFGDAGEMNTPPPAVTPPDAAGPLLSTGGKPSPNSEANVYAEKAMHFLRNQLDLSRARQMLEEALKLDPKFAEARVQYALTHILRIEAGESNDSVWLYRAEQELQQALRDDPDSIGAQGLLGAVYMMQGKKELGARQFLRFYDPRSPKAAVGHVWLQFYHWSNGEYAQGMALARANLQAAPLFWINRLTLGSMLHESGDPAAAVREFTSILDHDPQNQFALRELARGHIETGDTKTARIFLGQIQAADRRNFRVRLAWALLFAREGKRKEALREMDEQLQRYADLNPRLTAEAAEFYAVLGDKPKALDWLEEAVRGGDERVDWFRRNPLLESIRGEFRFKSLLDSIAYRRQQQKQSS